MGEGGRKTPEGIEPHLVRPFKKLLVMFFLFFSLAFPMIVHKNSKLNHLTGFSHRQKVGGQQRPKKVQKIVKNWCSVLARKHGKVEKRVEPGWSLSKKLKLH